MVFMCVTHQWVSHMWQKSSFLLATVLELTTGSSNMAVHHSDNAGSRGLVPKIQLPAFSLSGKPNRLQARETETTCIFCLFPVAHSHTWALGRGGSREQCVSIQLPAWAYFPPLCYIGHLITEHLCHLHNDFIHLSNGDMNTRDCFENSTWSSY